jgi:hypothetical protein
VARRANPEEARMETHDGRVIEAREALARARERDPGELTIGELRLENANFRKYVRWLIDVADDAADTSIDEEISQVTLWGGVYVAPADTLKLCDGCVKLLDLAWDAEAPPGTSPAGSAPADSAA